MVESGPEGGPQNAPRPQPIPTRGAPAHAAPENTGRIRLLLYGLTAALLVIAGIVWLLGRDDSSDSIDIASDLGTLEELDGADGAADDNSTDGSAADEGSTATGDEDTADEDTADDPEPDAAAGDSETDDSAGNGDDTSDEAADDASDEEPDEGAADEPPPDDPTEPADPVRSNPDTPIPDDAPADVADSLAAIEAGEVLESRGIVKGGRIFLVGSVPTQEEAESIAATAGEVLGAVNVFNYYVVDPRATDAGTGNVRVDDQVLFETGSDTIAPEFEPLLGQALVLMQIRPAVTLTVVGHTDSDGPADLNQALSEDRAQAVATWLIERGIDASRITTEGRGETEPIASNDTAEGRLANRRIQVFIENLLG